MASIEEIRQELNEAKERLAKAETVLKTFNEGEDGQWLVELKRKLRKEEGTETQQRRWEKEKTQLEEKEKQLEKDRRDRLEQVEKLQDRLTAATAQPGNDFVTRALGHRVMCT